MADKVVVFITIFICFFSCLKIVLTVKECMKVDQCKCSTDEGEISLWELAGKGKPRFSDIPSNNKEYTFSWNPCNPYSEGKCVDVAACQSSKSNKYSIAKQNTANCTLTGDGECALHYTGKGILTAPTQFTVTLRCDESQEGEVDPVNFQILTQQSTTVLHTKYACLRSSPHTGTHSGPSLGSVLVISFSCILVAYIICGVLVNKYARHIEGKEAFPNYSFWIDFPHLIKDGCVFTFQSLKGLCGKGSSRSGYASI